MYKFTQPASELTEKLELPSLEPAEMNESVDIFDLSPRQIFDHIVAEAHLLDDEMNNGLESAKLRALQLGTLLYHLREWICPGGSPRIKDNQIQLTLAQELYTGIFQLEAFRQLQDFVNSVKHGSKPKERQLDTREDQGFILGVSRLGSSFNRLHLFINNQDIVWEIIKPVIEYYKTNWFDKV